MTTTKAIRKDYLGRINNVMVYIEDNLDKELSLDIIAQVACFSPYHFHRIFSGITGETINTFINRKRLERSASLLMKGSELPLSSIAFDMGFNSASSFSRAFKKYYGISPSEFREMPKDQFSKIRKVDRKNSQVDLTFETYICNINNIKNWLEMNANVAVKEMPELQVAYVTHTGSFDQIGGAYERLMRWAGPKGLLSTPDLKTVTVYHDDPQVTEISKVRQSACITVDHEIATDGEVGFMKIRAGKYAVGRFEIGVMEFEQAWNSMCVWIADNGYQSREKDYYELYHNDHMQHPEQKFILDICIPVQ
ncbi:MAG: AraC family transcriptional regulator [Bacteroidetes bacterium]|nr:MAG: AraC family transcriptional regulator [Bacteroidota bacterium]